MKNKRILYSLFILRAGKGYLPAQDLSRFQRLQGFERSTTPFGPFNSGETINDKGRPLGMIQHVHHDIGETDNDELTQATYLYVSELVNEGGGPRKMPFQSG
jgi:hypothetical protein